jgi:hypothetical protein
MRSTPLEAALIAEEDNPQLGHTTYDIPSLWSELHNRFVLWSEV